MGIGDDIMATGLARGAHDRGRQIAFGDGRRIIWGPHCKEAFRYNPNIAEVVHERVEWIAWYKGSRWYNKLDSNGRRWLWNYEFSATPGEFYFSDAERAFAIRRAGAVLIEPNVPWHKSVAVNKDWGLHRYQRLADMLRKAGWRVFQNAHGTARLVGVEVVEQKTFRQAAAALSGFDLAILPEGGLHHAAAAVGAPAVVIFGGFIPPQVTGYQNHVNLTGGVEACGRLDRCAHCRAALDAIEVDQVYEAAHGTLQQ